MSPALATTFEWVWSKRETGFGDWLRDGRGLFWICEKPGSGKSTLVKYIVQSPRLAQGLVPENSDADNNPSRAPIIASFFFDYNSDTIAKSLPGMLRSLMWQILRQQPALFSPILDIYQTKKRTESSPAWTQLEL